MKHLFTLLLFFVTLSLFANDTLTMRQVYTFSKGDTLDYKKTSASSGPTWYNTTFNLERYVVDSVYYNQAEDTLFIIQRRIFPDNSVQLLFYTQLDSMAVKYNHKIAPNQQYLSGTFNSSFMGRTENTGAYVGFEGGHSIKVAEGLGVNYYSDGWSEPGSGYSDSHTEEIIFLGNDSSRYGIPYTTANGSHMLEFVPLPEECAVWTYYRRTPGSWTGLRRQFKTGNKVLYNNQWFVELLFSYYNYDDNTFQLNTLIGYFRNDTINRKTFFYSQLFGAPTYQYDYNKVIDGSSCINIDSVSILGEKRTRWIYRENYFNPSYPDGVIAGVGSTSCLVPMQAYCQTYNHWPFTGCDWGVLLCLDVCGQRVYGVPGSHCDLINDIPELASEAYKITITPNPAKDKVEVTIPGNLTNAQLLVVDELGRTLHLGEYYPDIHLDISQWQEGLYFVKIYNTEKALTARFVKE